MTVSSIWVSLPTLGALQDPADTADTPAATTPLFDDLSATEQFRQLFPARLPTDDADGGQIEDQTDQPEPLPPAQDPRDDVQEGTRDLQIPPPRTMVWYPEPADDAPQDPTPPARSGMRVRDTSGL